MNDVDQTAIRMQNVSSELVQIASELIAVNTPGSQEDPSKVNLAEASAACVMAAVRLTKMSAPSDAVVGTLASHFRIYIDTFGGDVASAALDDLAKRFEEAAEQERKSPDQHN